MQSKQNQYKNPQLSFQADDNVKSELSRVIKNTKNGQSRRRPYVSKYSND